MQLVDKMADQTLPGYQPRKFIDTRCVKDLSFQHRDEMFAFCNCCSNVVTVDLL